MPRVIQQDQHSTIGEDRAVERYLCFGRLRNLGRRDAECVQEAADRLGGRKRYSAWVVAAQVDIELPVRKPGRHLMTPAQGERRLADASSAADRGDDDGAAERFLV